MKRGRIGQKGSRGRVKGKENIQNGKDRTTGKEKLGRKGMRDRKVMDKVTRKVKVQRIIKGSMSYSFMRNVNQKMSQLLEIEWFL